MAAMAGSEQPALEATKATTETQMESGVEAAANAPNESSRQNEEEDEEEVVTLSEVIHEQSLLTEQADAVLGDCSESHCSYPLGYIRQALYACLTCTPASGDQVAGVCLACSYNCHADHELVELYTKRSFRCDCGNSKFPKENPCKLESDKAPLNDRNQYSQNYKGTYCVCHRPYPDPERTTEEIMVQCILCEDWFHDEHLHQSDAEASADSTKGLPQFDELICRSCMELHPFLAAYTRVDPIEQDTEDTENNPEQSQCKLVVRQAILNKQPTEKAKQEADQPAVSKPAFLKHSWREELCQCESCLGMYATRNLSFLVDPEDSLIEYESKAKENGEKTLEERAQKAFENKLSHEQQLEMAIGYSQMKQKLSEYLSTFAAGGKTVRSEDIQEFFSKLEETKKHKRQRTQL